MLNEVFKSFATLWVTLIGIRNFTVFNNHVLNNDQSGISKTVTCQPAILLCRGYYYDCYSSKLISVFQCTICKLTLHAWYNRPHVMCLHYFGGCAIRWPKISIVGNTMSAVGRYLAIPTFADIQYIQQGVPLCVRRIPRGLLRGIL